MRGAAAALLIASSLAMLATAAEPNAAPTNTHALGAWALVPDLVRSQERWQAGPLNRLATRPWMLAMLAPLTKVLAKRDMAESEVIAEAQALRELAAGIAIPLAPHDRGSPYLTMTGSGEHTLLTRLIGSTAIELPVADWPAWVTGAHDVVMREQGWIWRSTPVALPMVATSLLDDRTPTNPDVDAEAILAPDMRSALDDECDIRLPFPDADAFSAQWRLTANGVHETVREICHEALAATFREHPPLAIAPQRLLDLPGDTLLACAFTINREAFAAWFAHADDEGWQTTFSELAADRGLPTLSNFFDGLRDDAVMWCEAGAPVASVHADVGYDATAAASVLAELQANWQFTVNADASVQRQYQAMLVSVRYLDGRLQLSTSPFGFTDVSTNQRRFGENPAVQQAQQQWQHDAWCIAASRSNASWFAIGGLIQLGLMTGGDHRYGTFAADLYRAGTVGWLSIQFDGERTMTCDSAGLFGGPATWMAVNAISSEIMFAHRMDELAEPLPEFPAVPKLPAVPE